MAPANASAPPATHRPRYIHGLGTRPAMNGGANRIVPPMTLETMMAAPSSGPRRRSRVDEAAVDIGTGLYGAYGRLLCEELSLNRILGQLGPDARALFQVDLDLRVDELTVLQHLHARLLAGVAERRSHHQRVGGGAGRQRLARDRPAEVLAPHFLLADTAEDGVDLNRANRLIALVAQLHRHAGHELVLAAFDNAVVKPAGDDIDGLERGDRSLGGAAADGHRRGEGHTCERDQASHTWIVRHRQGDFGSRIRTGSAARAGAPHRGRSCLAGTPAGRCP